MSYLKSKSWKENIDLCYLDYKYIVQQGNILFSAFCTTLCQQSMFMSYNEYYIYNSFGFPRMYAVNSLYLYRVREIRFDNNMLFKLSSPLVVSA